jgi:AcrR family transcriptional regulator
MSFNRKSTGSLIMPSNNRQMSRIIENPKREDRRITRTRQLLRDAILALILERGYDAVTIQDITDRANLGRATFYIHYRDKEDLLLQTLKAIFDELVAQSGPPTLPGQKSERPTPIEYAFQHAAKNRDLYLVMLQSSASASVARQIRAYISQTVQTWARLLELPTALPFPIEVYAEHASGSLIGLLSWWLENDMPYPPERMAEIYRSLNVNWIPNAMKSLPSP